jgi:hypothetical protein
MTADDAGRKAAVRRRSARRDAAIPVGIRATPVTSSSSGTAWAGSGPHRLPDGCHDRSTPPLIPWGTELRSPGTAGHHEDFNWTRWRVSRDLRYRSRSDQHRCVGPWLPIAEYRITGSPVRRGAFAHDAPTPGSTSSTWSPVPAGVPLPHGGPHERHGQPAGGHDDPGNLRLSRCGDRGWRRSCPQHAAPRRRGGLAQDGHGETSAIADRFRSDPPA